MLGPVWNSRCDDTDESVGSAGHPNFDNLGHGELFPRIKANFDRLGREQLVA